MTLSRASTVLGSFSPAGPTTACPPRVPIQPQGSAPDVHCEGTVTQATGKGFLQAPHHKPTFGFIWAIRRHSGMAQGCLRGCRDGPELKPGSWGRECSPAPLAQPGAA